MGHLETTIRSLESNIKKANGSNRVIIPLHTAAMAIDLLKEKEQIIMCKDCKLQECEGRNGMIVCDITGESHRLDWFCADGEKAEK